MKNYEDLENEIRKALPELMDLKKGCLIKYDIIIYEIDDYLISVKNNNQIYNAFENKTYFSDEYDIIGHEIKLNHVLKWMNIFCTPIMYENELFSSKYDLEYHLNYKDKENYDEHFIKRAMWNLNSEYLKDQSEETKQFLINLIK